MTQSQIAEEIGVSQMHVSRLLNRTLEQLRARSEDCRPERSLAGLTVAGVGRGPSMLAGLQHAGQRDDGRDGQHDGQQRVRRARSRRGRAGSAG